MAEVVRRILDERMARNKVVDSLAALAGAGEGDGRFSGADHDRVLYGDRDG